MTEYPDWIAIPSVVFTFVVLPAWGLYSLARTRRQRVALADGLAAEGFDVKKGIGLFAVGVYGTYRSRDAGVRYLYRRPSWTTSVSLAVAPPPGFRLRAEAVGATTRIVKALGGQDARARFDTAFRVTTRDADRAGFVLDAETRASLLAWGTRVLSVERGRVTVDLPERVVDAAVVADALALAASVAERVEASR